MTPSRRASGQRRRAGSCSARTTQRFWPCWLQLLCTPSPSAPGPVRGASSSRGSCARPSPRSAGESAPTCNARPVHTGGPRDIRGSFFAAPAESCVFLARLVRLFANDWPSRVDASRGAGARPTTAASIAVSVTMHSLLGPRHDRRRASSRFFGDRHRHVAMLAFAAHELEGNASQCGSCRNALGNGLCLINLLTACLHNDISRDNSLLLGGTTRSHCSNERALRCLWQIVLLAQLRRQCTDLQSDPR